MYNNDIWDLIDENDIVDVKVNRLKKLFSNNDDYLFFSGTILSLPNKEDVTIENLIINSLFLLLIPLRHQFCNVQKPQGYLQPIKQHLLKKSRCYHQKLRIRKSRHHGSN